MTSLLTPSLLQVFRDPNNSYDVINTGLFQCECFSLLRTRDLELLHDHFCRNPFHFCSCHSYSTQLSNKKISIITNYILVNMTDNGENERLHREIPQYPYNGRDDLLAILDYEFPLHFPNEDFLLFTNVSSDRFQRDFLYSDETKFASS